MNHPTRPWRTTLAENTELDALLERVREDKADPRGKNRNAVAYDCWRMFEDLAKRFKEESAMRDRYKRHSDGWRDAALRHADYKGIAEHLVTWLSNQKYQSEPLLHAIVCCDFVSRSHLVISLAQQIEQKTRPELSDWREDWLGQPEL